MNENLLSKHFVIAATLAALALPSLAAASTIVYDTTGGSSFNGVGPIQTGGIEGDLFQISQSGTLASVAVALGNELNSGSVTGNVEILSDVNGQLGTELWGAGFFTTAPSQQGSTYSPLVNFNLSNGPQLNTGTNYWLAIFGTGGNVVTNSNVNNGVTTELVYGSAASPTYLTGPSPPLVAQIAVNPVPLPAAAWLMLSGLGGLGALARKRKAA